ncbi:MAG: DNA polymerase III subunit alpha [Bacteriovoracaceae bacterium]|jgi:DNA polymerase-3 subunit alpha|nr:DNA polymerase III subunit alpha [Bacteriovoracaceae bacterium]
MKNPFLYPDFKVKDDQDDGFVHLHLHTQYSLLDGAIRLDDLFEELKANGSKAVAMTDHGNMFGAIDFYTKAIQNGIKPILGSEVYFTPGSRFDRRAPKNTKTIESQDEVEGKHQIHHLVLLCKNNTGYKNLCKLLSKAYLEGFYYKPRIDLELLKEHSEGLIATTACLKGEAAFNFFTNQDDKAHQAIQKLKDIFEDDFYLEIQRHGLEEEKVYDKIIEYSKIHNIKLVATNDSHYLTREDSAAQEVLLCIQTGKTFLDEKRMKLTTDEFYLKSPAEMREAFKDLPQACDHTLEIADKCNVEITWQKEDGSQVYHLPDFDRFIETGENTQEFFIRESREGLERRFKGPHFKKIVELDNWETELKQVYYDRLQVELDTILQMGFPGYFCIVSDFIQWTKDNGIPVGPGRGSGAGSLVAYALDITNINPIPYNLLFERFINLERISMPDFDIDFCQDRRPEVIEYVTQKYGIDKVGQIITFGKLQAKAVIRDVSRVFALPYAEADALAKLIPDELGITLKKAIEMEPRLSDLEERDPKIRRILQISKRLEGLLRHASIHAAGVIITNDPLVNYCPLYKGREGEQVVQFDKDFSEKIGLVKFDFLGLKTLTVIQNAVNFVKRDHKDDFDIEYIDMEDKYVYDYISEGKTTGVFQLESSGMKDLCARLKPESIDDITAINALYRPGPMGLGMHDEFIERKFGRKEVDYFFEGEKSLEDVLYDTYGIIVYQEQVMNIARTVGGYSLGEADMLRRAMGKKKEKEMARHREIFLAGAKERGYDTKKAAEVYDLMAEFAKYGFNKSHAVAYAVIAYQTAFLKRYYPACFFAALLGTEMNNTDKVTAYINDARQIGIEILPPDVNESLFLFNVIGKNIRFGMGAIKNVGAAPVAAIIKEREENGPFKSFIDFCERVSMKSINKRVVESLIKVGAFDSFEKMNRKTLLENLEQVMNYAAKKQEEKLKGQVNLFDMAGAFEEPKEKMLDINPTSDFDDKEKLSYEQQLLGIYVSGHPLEKYGDILKELISMPIKEINELPKVEKPEFDFRNRGKQAYDPSRRNLTIAGIVAEKKAILTKKGDRMAFVTLEDLSGKIECLFFPSSYAEYHEFLEGDDPIVIEGYVKLSEERRSFFVNKVRKVEDETDTRVSSVKIQIEMDKLHDHSLSKLKSILLSYRGTVPAKLCFESENGEVSMDLGENYLVNPVPQMAVKVNEVLNSNSVSFIVDGQNN